MWCLGLMYANVGYTCAHIDYITYPNGNKICLHTIVPQDFSFCVTFNITAA